MITVEKRRIKKGGEGGGGRKGSERVPESSFSRKNKIQQIFSIKQSILTKQICCTNFQSFCYTCHPLLIMSITPLYFGEREAIATSSVRPKQAASYDQ